MIVDDFLLRKPEPEDVPYLYKYRNDPAVIGGLGGFSTGYSTESIREWVERRNKSSDDIVWIIAEKESNVCVGHVGLYQIDHRVRVGEFAILIGDPLQWNKGIGRKVTARVMAYGFDELNLNRIELSVLASNERAIRLYEGLGFMREGVKRQAQFRAGAYLDVVLMATLRAERKS
jgi:RimJ/RimL family protein N-acetyltransferase